MMTWMPTTWVSHTWSATYTPGKEPEQYYSNVRVIQELKFLNFIVPFTKTDGKIRQIGPALVHMPIYTSIGLFIVIETVTPVGPLMQRVEHSIFGPKFPIYRPIGKFIMRAFSQQFIRDVHIWNNKKFFSAPVLVKGDGPIAQFRRWYSQFYSANSKTADLDMSW
jgi:cholesterol 7-dehydrogenase